MNGSRSPNRRIVWLTADRFSVKPDKSTWLEMAKCLASYGWQVRIIAVRTSRNEDAKYEDYVDFIGALEIPFLFRFLALLSSFLWLRRNLRKTDVVMVNQDGLWLLWPLRLLGARQVVLDVRTLPVSVYGFKGRLDWLLFWRIPLSLFLKKVDGYSFITERLRREVEREFKVQIHEHVIWQSGVNLQLFDSNPEVGRVDEHSLRLFYHGSITVQRGLAALIEAVGAEKPSECCHIELVIVGDGPDREKLKHLAEELPNGKRIAFLGFMPYESIVSEIQRADVCVCPLPDRLEWNVSSPLKVLEYMACGKPMILTPIPAHLDLLRSAPFVVWTDGYQAEDFSRAIAQVRHKFDDLNQAAKGARTWLKLNGCEWQQQAKTLSDFLETLGQRRSALAEHYSRSAE